MLTQRLRGGPGKEEAFTWRRWRALARPGAWSMVGEDEGWDGASRLQMELSAVLISGMILAWWVKGGLCQ